jgi:hypothetical protein
MDEEALVIETAAAGDKSPVETVDLGDPEELARKLDEIMSADRQWRAYNAICDLQPVFMNFDPFRLDSFSDAKCIRIAKAAETLAKALR